MYLNKCLQPKKLEIRRCGPYQINKVIGDNACQIALPPKSQMPATVNTSDLVPSKGPPTAPIFVPDPSIVPVQPLDI